MRLLLLFLAFTLSSVPATAETRAAFVVGNSAYEHAPSLDNPVRDAGLIAETLEALDFAVDLQLDLTRDGFARALSAFLRDNAEADVTLFYFAGHGMQYQGRNYLVGTDAQLATELDIDGEATRLDQVLELLERRSKAALVFVDACRDNPLADRFYRENFSETRALATRGLAPLETSSLGSMVVFAASPGQVAYDGTGGNSPFAEALARHLPAENVEVLSLMKRVIGDVKRETGDRQVPMVTNDLTREIYLKLGEGGAGASLALQQEQAMFDAAVAINSERGWDIFLGRFPDGSMRDLALVAREDIAAARLAQLSDAEVTPDGSVSVTRDVAEQAEAALGLSREDARAVQTALNTRGYGAGAADGQIGPRTRRAIADFQAAAGLASTGVVTAGTASALNLSLTEPEEGAPIVSSPNARRYDPKILAQIEDDPRLLKAADVLSGKEFVYGYFQGRLYIGLLQWCCDSWETANARAKEAGGHLVTITTSAENRFVYDLVKNDERFWETYKNEWVMGPTIGLFQKPNSREPDGGWVWVTGEPNDWINWQPPFPNNNFGTASIGGFGHRPPGSPNFKGPQEFGHWDDYNNVARSYIIEIE